MAIKITTTRESTDFIKALVYGESGIGKTTLCATAPDPIIISAEKGLLSLKDHDIPVIEIFTPDDFEEAYKYVKKKWKSGTVCLDSVSDICETVLAYYKENPVDGNTHPQAAYGSMGDFMLPMIKKFRDLEGVHVYFTAKAKRMKDDYTGITSWMPSMPGQQLGPNLPYLFDFVFHMKSGEKEGENKKKIKYRYLQTVQDIQSVCKDRSGMLKAIEKPDLSYIIKKALGEIKPKKKTKVKEKK